MNASPNARGTCIYLMFHIYLYALQIRLKIGLKLLGSPFVVDTDVESWRKWWMVFRCFVPHHHHSYGGLHFLLALHQPDARVVTDETDDGVAIRRHNDSVLDDWIDAIPRRRPVYNSTCTECLYIFLYIIYFLKCK